MDANPVQNDPLCYKVIVIVHSESMPVLTIEQVHTTNNSETVLKQKLKMVTTQVEKYKIKGEHLMCHLVYNTAYRIQVSIDNAHENTAKVQFTTENKPGRRMALGTASSSMGFNWLSFFLLMTCVFL